MSFLSRGDSEPACAFQGADGVLDEQVLKLVEKFGADAVSASLRRCRRETPKEVTSALEDLENITLKEERELNRVLLDASFEAVVLCNKQGEIIKVNKTALKVLGYADEEELLGKSVSVMVGGGEATYHDEYFDKYQRRGMHSPHLGRLREVKAKRKDGSEFPCILGIKKLPGKDSTLTVGFMRDITKEKEAVELAIQKRAAEELLMNVLPEEVAIRLRKDPCHIADHFTTATILFADIVGFTEMSSKMEAAKVVAMLNDLFSRFDKCLGVYGLNKIKTIGDCYMITSVPNGGKDPDVMCMAVCHFALDMLDVLDEYNKDHEEGMEKPLSVRVGMDCGPIVAGVIGTKRFLYDVWGHPVNVASRMESTGQPRRIQVTKNIVDSVPSNEFSFLSRGVTQVKGVGEMSTFFLEKRLKTRSSNYWTLFEASKNSKSDRRVSANDAT